MASLFAVEDKFAQRGRFAESPYGCSVCLTSKKAVSNSVGTAISWDSASNGACYNDGQPWSSKAKTRFSAPEEGVYQLSFSVTWGEAAKAGERSVFITVNGNEDNKLADSQGTFQSETQLCTAMTFLDAGDYMEARVYQDSGVSDSLLADAYGTSFEVGRATFEKVR
jgi:hypothetical protein